MTTTYNMSMIKSAGPRMDAILNALVAIGKKGGRAIGKGGRAIGTSKGGRAIGKGGRTIGKGVNVTAAATSEILRGARRQGHEVASKLIGAAPDDRLLLGQSGDRFNSILLKPFTKAVSNISAISKGKNPGMSALATQGRAELPGNVGESLVSLLALGAPSLAAYRVASDVHKDIKKASDAYTLGYNTTWNKFAQYTADNFNNVPSGRNMLHRMWNATADATTGLFYGNAAQDRRILQRRMQYMNENLEHAQLRRDYAKAIARGRRTFDSDGKDGVLGEAGVAAIEAKERMAEAKKMRDEYRRNFPNPYTEGYRSTGFDLSTPPVALPPPPVALPPPPVVPAASQPVAPSTPPVVPAASQPVAPSTPPVASAPSTLVVKRQRPNPGAVVNSAPQTGIRRGIGFAGRGGLV